MGRGDLGAMGIVVNRCQGMHKAPYARTQERHHCGTQRPQHRHLVRVVTAATVHHVEGKHGHHEER